MFGVDNKLRNILPIVIIESNMSRPVSFRGTGFLIAPNILITCWQCVRDALQEKQRYAVMFEESSGYSIHSLLDIKQHSEGLDLAVAHVDLASGQGLRIGVREALPGDEVIAYGYSPGERVFAGEQISISQLNPRLMHGHITRSFHYNYPGFVQTYSYELNMPMPNGIYGAPVIKSVTNEVIGVIFGILDIPRAGYPKDIKSITRSSDAGEKQVMTLGLAHHTDSLQEFQGTITSGERVIIATDIDKDADREFGGMIVGLGRASTASVVHEHRRFQNNTDVGPEDNMDEYFQPSKGSTFSWDIGRGKRVFIAGLAYLGEFTIFSIGVIKRIPLGIMHMRKQFDRIHETIRAREEKAKAAEIERMYRKLRRYETQLNPAYLAQLKEQRRIVEELKLLFPTDIN